MKIVVIELEGHAECLYSFCKIFEHHRPKVTILSNQAVFEELKDELRITEDFFWYTKKPDEHNTSFLQQHLEVINQQDIVLLNTTQKQVNQYPIQEIIPPTILRIHNVNTFLDRWQNLTFPSDFYALWKDFSYVIRELFLQREWQKVQTFLQKIDYFTFPSQTIEQYVIEQKLLPNEKIFPVIPLACNQPFFLKKTVSATESIHFTVSGTIDKRRKEYQLLLNAWTKLLPQVSQSIKLTLLGQPKGPYGKKILQGFEALVQKHTHFQLQSYQKRVEQTTFNDIMHQTDVLLAPILLDTRYKIYQERYGYTKISGSWSDVIRYAKPAIFPSDYPIPKGFKTVIDTYSTKQELINLLKKYTFTKGYLQKKQTGIYNKMINYSPEQLQQSIINNFKKIL